MVDRVVIMAGGTGGHVFPALAVAQELAQRGVVVTWIGTQKGLEADVVPKAGIPIDWVTISGLRGNGALGWLMAPFRLIRALMQARRIIAERKPGAVLGMGGFVTGPGGVAAWTMGVPLLVHEQNSIPGMTNRWLTRIATRVMVAFPRAFAAEVKAIHTGNPLREDILRVAPPAERFVGRTGPVRVLVIGGSLGAAALNETVPAAIKRFAPGRRPEVWHQTGKRNLESAQGHYSAAGVDARVVAFIDNMADAYAWADLVICRAGALTISELAAVGVGAILVPYPHAVDDHQTTNAHYLSEAGAAMLIQQSALSGDSLYPVLAQLCGDRSRLLAMAQAARKLALPESTRQVANICLEAAHV